MAYIHDGAYIVRSVTVPANGASVKIWASATGKTGSRWVYDMTYAGRRITSETRSTAKAKSWMADVDSATAAGTAITA